MAANAQGKFWQMHDLMFANQGALDRESLDKYAKQVGLNLATFKKAMDSKQYLAAVDADVKLGGEAAVNGTPSLFLNGARVQDPTNFDAVSGMIERSSRSSPRGASALSQESSRTGHGSALYCAAMTVKLRSVFCASLATLAAGCGGLNMQMVDRSVQKPSNIAVYFTVDTTHGDPVAI